MREHKYRAYHDGKMVYNAAKVGNALFWNDGQFFDLFAFKQKNPAILMDYIGFTDLTEKEIYEGDVLKDEYNRILLVEWHNCAFCFKAITPTNFIYACDITQWLENEPCPKIKGEVIGNHFETPELVK